MIDASIADVFIADLEVQASFVDDVLPGGQASKHIHYLIGKYKSARNNCMDLADPDVEKYRKHFNKEGGHDED